MITLNDQLKVFRAMLDALKDGHIHWSESGDDSYGGTQGSLSYGIEFSYPTINDGVAMDRDRVEIHISSGDSSVVHRFYVGSEGYYLAIAILRFGLPELWNRYGDEGITSVDRILDELARLPHNS